MENQKIWIIGDSFTGVQNKSWIIKTCEHFKGDKYYTSSRGSRDTQTILDIFLRKLHLIKDNDFVILMLPTPERIRLPLANPMIDIEYSNEYFLQVDREKHLDYFIGSHQYEKDGSGKELEYPLTGLDENYIEHSEYELNGNLMRIVNSSTASINNFTEIIKSLKSYLPFPIILFSWTDDYPSDIVLGKTQITSELGFWESLHDIFVSNGEVGPGKADFHWSPKTNEAFANYIIKTYPDYFNI
jgi:predicted nucleic-acid-binding Zn-ribbon protein